MIIITTTGIHVLSLDTMSWTHPVVVAGTNPFPRVVVAVFVIVVTVAVDLVVIIN